MGFLLSFLFFSACGAEHDFRKAAFLESVHRYPSAVKAFERFASRHPADPRAAEALVRAARIYARVFGRCAEANPLYERAAREYAGREPWPTVARQGLLDCPEYFPLRDGMRWTYVDSQTGGKNMTLELQVSASSDGAHGAIDGAYYAGRKRFQDYHRSYLKQDWAIWEGAGRKPPKNGIQDSSPRGRLRGPVAVLKYPYAPGMAWKGRREGHPVEFKIESNSTEVSVRAGTFRDCLKVRESLPGAAAWQYQYYAPGVGKVKTTIGGSGFETPNTELKSVSTPEVQRN